MRVLAVGSLPPPSGARADSLLVAVTDLVAEGETVTTLALSPTAAAHAYLPAPGLLACARLWAVVPRYDAVVIQLEPGLPVRARAGRAERALSLLALAAALRRSPAATVRVHHLDDLPGGHGGRAAASMWAAAGQVVAGDEGVVAGLVAAGLDRSKVVAAAAPVTAAPPEREGWGDGADASAEHVTGLVRARAAAERRAMLVAPEGSAAEARVIGWSRLPAPGAGLVEAGLDGPSRPPGLGGIARAALARADRRPYLRPLAGTARAARRAAKSVVA